MSDGIYADQLYLVSKAVCEVKHPHLITGFRKKQTFLYFKVELERNTYKMI